MESEKWRPVSLTHVEYIEGDGLGHLLAYISLFPMIIVVSMITLILFRRDLHTIFFFVGLVVNEIVNFTLKHIIKEPRPFTRSVQHVKYGMPSSHAEIMAFFTSYLAFFLYIRIHHNCSWRDNMWKHASFFIWINLTLLVCFSRVYLMYHTLAQVVCGLFVGILFGILWFYIVHFCLSPHFHAITTWQISEYLMIRDLTPIPNLLWFEYCTQRNEARSRLRKGNCKKIN